MNTLIVLGTGAAWLHSTVAVLVPSIFPKGTATPFYDVATAVTTLVVHGLFGIAIADPADLKQTTPAWDT